MTSVGLTTLWRALLACAAKCKGRFLQVKAEGFAGGLGEGRDFLERHACPALAIIIIHGLHPNYAGEEEQGRQGTKEGRWRGRGRGWCGV